MLTVPGFEEQPSQAAIAAPDFVSQAPAIHGNVPWNKDQLYYLIMEVQKQQAYKKTTVKMEDKWTVVVENLWKRPLFAPFTKVKWDSAQRKFQRELEQVKKTYALEEEGANLSGLGEASESTKALMSIAEELHNTKIVADQAKEKDAKVKKVMLTHEKVCQFGLPIKHIVF